MIKKIYFSNPDLKMKHLLIALSLFIIMILTACNKPVTGLTYDDPDCRVLFIHHSTGNNIWHGDIAPGKRVYLRQSICMVPRLIKEFNEKNNKKISIGERTMPTGNPYPWENYPYDYYNIWVKNAGDNPYMEEPTLEILTKSHDIIIFKHCFPGSNILEDKPVPDIDSKEKTLANYKLQYNALKKKLHEFQNNKFIVWTVPALTESATNEEEATRAGDFAKWVLSEWDEPGDNIFIFDFRQIETEGGPYIKREYSVSSSDSHPNRKLSEIAAGKLVDKIIEVI